MRSLERPSPDHDYDAAVEIAGLVEHRDNVPDNPQADRRIPDPTPGHVLLATWNIANLGVHKRRAFDWDVIAEIVSWFEIVAVQEIADNRDDFDELIDRLPDHFRTIFNDRAGNNERAAFIYDSRRVTLGPKIGEVAIVESDRADVKLPTITRKFHGFNRNPYIATFTVDDVDLLIANCHLLYGPTDTAARRKASLEKRQLEAYAISRWCDLRRSDQDRYTKHILALGDFNLPKAERGDPIFDALTSRGLRVPPHDSRIPTNVSRDKDYDQVTVVPGLKRRIKQTGVFDFDQVIFGNLWDPDESSYWRTCTKYYISDHRPVWTQLELPD